jgi:DNA sulfur modification protein DndE
MKLSDRIRISTESSLKLKTLKGKTGLTPNLLCRFALCFSLNDQKVNHITLPNEEGLEFNRFTLTGEFDSFFNALIRERCVKDKLDPEKDFQKVFKLHLNNGIACLHSRVKEFSDLINLLE